MPAVAFVLAVTSVAAQPAGIGQHSTAAPYVQAAAQMVAPAQARSSGSVDAHQRALDRRRAATARPVAPAPLLLPAGEVRGNRAANDGPVRHVTYAQPTRDAGVRPAQFVQDYVPISDGPRPSAIVHTDEVSPPRTGYVPPLAPTSEAPAASPPQFNPDFSGGSRSAGTADGRGRGGSALSETTRDPRGPAPARRQPPADMGNRNVEFQPATRGGGYRADSEAVYPPQDDMFNDRATSAPRTNRNADDYSPATPATDDPRVTYGRQGDISRQRMVERVSRQPEVPAVPAGAATAPDGGPVIPPNTRPPVPATTNTPRESGTGPLADPYQQSSAPGGLAADGSASPEGDTPKTGTYFFTLLALFASIGMNLYLGWIAWDTYNRYQDLVADMRHSSSRRDRPEREPGARRSRRLVETTAY